MYEENNADSNLEELILSYALFYIKPEYFQNILEVANEEHFFFNENRLIFLALKKAYEEDIPLHAKTIQSLLNPSDFVQHKDKRDGISEYFAKVMGHVQSGVYALDIEKLCLKLKDLFLRRGIDQYIKNISLLINDDKQSTNAVLENIDKETANIRGEINLTDNIYPLSSISNSTIKEIFRLFKSEDKVMQGTSTGFTDLDIITGGLGKSDLIILAGRASMGKTAFALNLSANMAKTLQEQKKSILFFSLEMSGNQIANRIIAIKSGVNSFKMRTGRIKESDFREICKVTKEIDGLPFYIDETPSLDIHSLKRLARKMSITKNLGMIVVDYLQLVTTVEKTSYYNRREQEVSTITRGLKSLAKELNIPVLALAQLSRNVETRETHIPQLSDLRESGSIEQEADVVMFIYREYYYKRLKEPKNGTQLHEQWQSDMEILRDQADIIIAKHRNGPIGTVKLLFDEETGIFSNKY